MSEVAQAGALVGDGAALLARIRARRDGAAAYVTNYYADLPQTEAWAAHGLLREFPHDGCLLVLRRDRDFQHVYHAAGSGDALRDALRALVAAAPAVTYVTDIVDRPAAIAGVVASYAEAGFAPHRVLVRMSRSRATNDAIEPADPEVEIATPADAPAVVDFFERLLDPYGDQVPVLAEVEALARAGQVLIVRRGAELGGVLVFELRGQTAILRYWWVNPRYRAHGIGARLIRTMFGRCAAAARTVLWVVEGNENAITKYEHYGFRREGLVDQIMMRPRSLQP